jgi:hypothetical protein
MNIAAEKEALIHRLYGVEDLAVLDAVKDLLDFAQTTHDLQLEKELEIGIKQSDNREVRPHNVVWAEIRNRYRK